MVAYYRLSVWYNKWRSYMSDFIAKCHPSGVMHPQATFLPWDDIWPCHLRCLTIYILFHSNQTGLLRGVGGLSVMRDRNMLIGKLLMDTLILGVMCIRLTKCWDTWGLHIFFKNYNIDGLTFLKVISILGMGGFTISMSTEMK